MLRSNEAREFMSDRWRYWDSRWSVLARNKWVTLVDGRKASGPLMRRRYGLFRWEYRLPDEHEQSVHFESCGPRPRNAVGIRRRFGVLLTKVEPPAAGR